MKYVILEHHEKTPIVLAGCLIEHVDLCAFFCSKGYAPKSAGFFRILPGGKFETFGFSSSLNLTPNREDARLLEVFHQATLKTAPTVPSMLEEPRSSSPQTLSDPLYDAFRQSTVADSTWSTTTSARREPPYVH